MSPLLTSRPPSPSCNRLLAACVVMAAIAAGLALGNPGDARPSAAVPTFYAAGLLCAGLVAYLLVVAARIVEDRRLLWMAVAATVAGAALAARTWPPRQSLISEPHDRVAIPPARARSATCSGTRRSPPPPCSRSGAWTPRAPRLLRVPRDLGRALLYALIDTEPFGAFVAATATTPASS